jgi:hypothetical protein
MKVPLELVNLSFKTPVKSSLVGTPLALRNTVSTCFPDRRDTPSGKPQLVSVYGVKPAGNRIGLLAAAGTADRANIEAASKTPLKTRHRIIVEPPCTRTRAGTAGVYS